MLSYIWAQGYSCPLEKEVMLMGKTINRLLNIILAQWVIIVFLVVYLLNN